MPNEIESMLIRVLSWGAIVYQTDRLYQVKQSHNSLTTIACRPKIADALADALSVLDPEKDLPLTSTGPSGIGGEYQTERKA